MGFSVSVSNAGGNEIDAFLRRDVELSVAQAGDGTARLIADVTLHNDAPPSGLPAQVIGNRVGRPPATSRLRVTFWGPPLTLDRPRSTAPSPASSPARRPDGMPAPSTSTSLRGRRCTIA